MSRVTAELKQLLDVYGAGELEQAIAEAFDNAVPHPSGVRQVLERRRVQRDRLPPITLTLPDNGKARNIVARAPSWALCDQLPAESWQAMST